MSASASPEIHGYHAHIYYDQATRSRAEALREALATNFPVKVGELRDEPAGPHPVPQFAAIFTTPEFQTVVPWLMLHRSGLDVLIHPLTDDMVDDHSVYAIWLGTPITLKLHTMQRRGYGTALLPAA